MKPIFLTGLACELPCAFLACFFSDKDVVADDEQTNDEEKDAINNAVSALEEAVKSDDLADIEAKTKDLTDASTGLAQKLYAEQAQAEGAAGAEAEAGEAGQSTNEDAVDAEFEEVEEDK